ncbi:hypothetical protein [Actinomycetospora soli]|uniref:hypothetical protein n=1 Tax=Actinomycetospora soli TaxID=2893887 RepID=UPI001E38A938|nr:hypothetical protein [Actinomycetospora soli]MCD2191618.1 hypothetical protein [Actinomycetospora soli]
MVAVYPYVGSRERDAALRRIAARHLRCEDSRWSEAGCEGDDPARDVLDYLRRHHTRLPRAVSSEDTRDALVLSAWIYWEERRRERDLLRRARGYGHSLGELGAFLGLNTRQGTYDYLDRLEALVEAHSTDQARQQRVADERVERQRAADGAVRDAELLAGPLATSTLAPADDLYRRTRGRRASTAGAGPDTVRSRRRDRTTLPARERWIAEHRGELDVLVSELLGQLQRLGIEAREQESEDFELEDTLAVLDRHRETGDYSPATFGALGLVLGELRFHPAVEPLAHNHGVHQAIVAADRLRARFSALS